MVCVGGSCQEKRSRRRSGWGARGARRVGAVRGVVTVAVDLVKRRSEGACVACAAKMSTRRKAASW